MSRIKYIENIENVIIFTTVFLYPFFFLNFFSNTYELPKLIILFASVTALSFIKLIKLVNNSNFTIVVGKFDFAILLIAIAYLVSALFSIVNKIDAFFLPATASFVILSAVFYFFVNQTSQKVKDVLLILFVSSVFILTITQIAIFFEINKIIPFLQVGNSLNSISLIIATLPFLIYKIFEKTEIAEKILSSLVVLVLLLGLGIITYQTFFNKETALKLLDLKFGWPITVDSIKVNPLLGVGPSNFNYAFDRFKPIEYNLSPNWNLKYIQNSSFLLTAISEVGILGLISFIYLIYLIFVNPKLKNPKLIAIFGLVSTLLLLPVSIVLIFILFLLLAMYSETRELKLGYFFNKIPQFLIIVPVFTILVVLTYFFVRAVYAEYLFTESFKSRTTDGLKTYNLINKAVSLNPYSDKYHLFASTVNMAIAENIAKKEELTDEDRKNISALIQQAIREGKAGVAVNKHKSTNWETLSDVYKLIISFAEGADQFAIQSLNQAIILDPINPLLRLKMGGLYFSLKKYDESIETLKLAVLAKKDFPNAYYNLALAYKANKQLDKAKENINIVMNLLGKDSADYETALKELQSIEELTKPQEKIEPAVEPQIELPSE